MKVTQNLELVTHARAVGTMVCEMKWIGVVAKRATLLIKATDPSMLTRV